MRFMETGIEGAWVIDPSPHQDDRGRFLRAWCAREFAEHAINFLPVQANLGFSKTRGTVRGMHFQEAPAIEAKLIRCNQRSDLRCGSGPQAGVAIVRRVVRRRAECRELSNALRPRELRARIPDARRLH